MVTQWDGTNIYHGSLWLLNEMASTYTMVHYGYSMRWHQHIPWFTMVTQWDGTNIYHGSLWLLNGTAPTYTMVHYGYSMRWHQHIPWFTMVTQWDGTNIYHGVLWLLNEMAPTYTMVHYDCSMHMRWYHYRHMVYNSIIYLFHLARDGIKIPGYHSEDWSDTHDIYKCQDAVAGVGPSCCWWDSW